jgi:hypothetical protein
MPPPDNLVVFHAENSVVRLPPAFIVEIEQPDNHLDVAMVRILNVEPFAMDDTELKVQMVIPMDWLVERYYEHRVQIYHLPPVLKRIAQWPAIFHLPGRGEQLCQFKAEKEDLEWKIQPGSLEINE